jgi:hypothetical protein
MKILSLASLLAISLLTTQSPVLANDKFKIGSALLRECNSDVFRATCTAYISGVVDGSELISGDGKREAKLVCIPVDSVTAGQLRLVVVKYLNEHPEELHQPASWLIEFAFIKAFPC